MGRHHEVSRTRESSASSAMPISSQVLHDLGMISLTTTGETIPIRLFLGGFDLTPTFRDVNKKYSTRYYLSLVLIDEGKPSGTPCIYHPTPPTPLHHFNTRQRGLNSRDPTLYSIRKSPVAAHIPSSRHCITILTKHHTNVHTI